MVEIFFYGKVSENPDYNPDGSAGEPTFTHQADNLCLESGREDRVINIANALAADGWKVFVLRHCASSAPRIYSPHRSDWAANYQEWLRAIGE